MEQVFVLGISYKNTSLDIREKYSISESQQILLLKQLKYHGTTACLTLSTCNRTEIWFQGVSPFLVRNLWLSFVVGELEEFNANYYLIKNDNALLHITRVASGLESQVLGDSQIISQIKNSIKMSSQLGLLRSQLDRFARFALNTSKKVKNITQISTGASSIAYLAVQMIIKKTIKKDPNIVLIGAGKINTVTCYLLKKQLPLSRVSILNRDHTNGRKMQEKLNYKPNKILSMEYKLKLADIVVVATSSPKIILEKKHFTNNRKECLIIDLAVPRNVSNDLSHIPGKELVNIEILDGARQETLAKRRSSISKAETLISTSKMDFWCREAKRKEFTACLEELQIDLA